LHQSIQTRLATTVHTKQVRLQLPTSADNVTLLTLLLNARWPIDISCPLGSQQQTRCSGVQWTNNGMVNIAHPWGTQQQTCHTLL